LDKIKFNIYDFKTGEIKEKYINADYILYKLFKCDEVKDTRKKAFEEKGHPDYIIKKDNRKIFVEWKSKDDGLRADQLGWFFKNKDKERCVVWLPSDQKEKEVFGDYYFECPSCGTIIIKYMKGRFTEPERCPCGRKSGFREISEDEAKNQPSRRV